MKALIYREFGAPNVLEWTENWPEPSVGPNSVRIRCLAGGVNPKDVLLRKGKFRALARDPLPRVSGMEIAGEVVEVGKNVTSFAEGETVFGMTNRFSGGIHSEWAVLDAGEIALAPDNISISEAAAIPLAAQTALQALQLGKLEAGQKVLINGASGGVGHFAVQIANALKAEVHAVCGLKNQDFARSLGAHAVYDYTAQPAPSIAESFHVVFDVFGKFKKKHFAKQLGRQGVFISTVPKPATLAGECLARLGVSSRSRLVGVRSNTEDLNRIRTWVETDQLKPHIDGIYPVERAAEAHQHVESKHTRGKVVLTFSETLPQPVSESES